MYIIDITSMICIQYEGKLYNIATEPFETISDTFKRGWFIVKNYDKYSDYNELYSLSIMMINKNKGMNY